MAGTAADVVRVLKGEVGYQEGRSGGHWNNKQKYSAQVAGLEWSDYQAWCCTFTCWAFQQAGMPKGSYPVTASCALAVAWWKKAGRWSEYPAIGAPVFFGPGGGSHTGIVIGYDANTITTIEGNTNTSGSAEGDGVYRKTRQRRDTYVYGYGYPAYPGGIKSADPNWKNPTAAPSKEDNMPTPADVWKADLIPAAAPPYGNSDYSKNKTWTASYALGSAVLTGRKVEAKVTALTAQVAALAAAVQALARDGGLPLAQVQAAAEAGAQAALDKLADKLQED